MAEQVTTSDGRVVAERLEVASTMWSRFLGLMGRRELPAGDALWLAPCSQVHTFFCRFPMDVAFLDRDGRILHIAHAMKPWRVGRLVLRAKAALELPGGTLAAMGVTKGERLVRSTAPTADAGDPITPPPASAETAQR
jgi:uncharacterized membrane protein (UPF0127 family)